MHNNLDTFSQIVEILGATKVYEPSESFVPSIPTSVWYIHEGKINLSLAKKLNGVPFGQRFNIINVISDNLLFCIVDDQNEDYCIVATIIEPTKITELSHDFIKEYLALGDSVQSKLHNGLKNLVQKWIVNLLHVTDQISTIQRPPSEILIQKQGLHYIDENCFITTNQNLLWIYTEHSQSIQLYNSFGLNYDFGIKIFPLTKDIIIHVKENIELQVFDSVQLVLDENFWQSITGFHTSLSNYLIWEFENYKELEERRLHQKYSLMDSQFNKSIFEASDLLNKFKKYDELQIDTYNVPLFDALKLIGKYENINFIIPKELDTSIDPLGDICRFSKIRFREILLESNWYKHNINAILGFGSSMDEPIALIPNKKRGFVAYNFKQSSITTVNKNNYYAMSKIAFVFYKPFPEKAITISTLFKIGFSNNKKEIINAAIYSFIVALITLIVPFVTSLLFDYIIPNANYDQLLFAAFALIIAAFSSIMFTICKNVSLLRIEGKIDYKLQAALWDRLLDLPAHFFKQYTSGDLADRSLCLTQIKRIISGTIIISVLTGIFSLLNIIVLFLYNVSLAIMALLIVTTFITLIYFLGRRIIDVQKDLYKKQGQNSGFLLQILSSISTFRVAGVEQKVFVQWFKRFIVAKELSILEQKKLNKIRLLNTGFMLFSTITIYIGVNTLSGTMSTGEFLGFFSAWGAFMTAMVGLCNSLIDSFRIIPMFDRVKPILETIPENLSIKSPPTDLKGNIEFANVSFKYQSDAPYILQGISFEIRKGEFIAIVGPSGSGKSTIIRLLLGFNDPESGKIFYDGQDLDKIDPKLLRRQIGVVLQDGSLMADDIFSNIVGASTNLTINDAWTAAKAVGLEEDIKAMPMGMYTILSETGGTLSGGQKQRLMIARAIVHKPKILIFDEATSALDNKTQAVVTESLKKLKVTRIVIAHRLSTIIDADRIVYLEDGKISELGTYNELMKLNGKFASLAKRQL